jgi:ankyrin repeat protein
VEPKIEIIKLFLENKFDFNIKDRNGKGTLHHFCSNRSANLKTLKFLVEECKVDINLLNKSRQTCLFKLNFDLKEKNEIFQYLIEKKIDLNVTDEHGFDILHYILKNTTNYNNSLLQLLFDQNIDVVSSSNTPNNLISL